MADKQRETVFLTDCGRVIDFLDRATFTFTEHGRFFIKTPDENPIPGERFARAARAVADAGLVPAIKAHAISGGSDFGHTAPDWETILHLGIPGIRQRIAACRAENPTRVAFYDALTSVWDAIERFLLRVARGAEENGQAEMAQGIRRQLVAPPATLYEGLQLILIVYVLQMAADPSPVRTLGRLDSLLWYLARETEEADTDWLIRDFILEVEEFGVPANIPFALGGTDLAGNSLICPLSYRILAVYASLTVPHVKMHLLISENTPDDFLLAALSSVRAGKNSMVFLGDETVIRSLEKLGERHVDAVPYTVVGCYECGGYQEIACTCNGIVNIQKAVEYALTGGVDMVSGEQIGLPPSGPAPATMEEFVAEVGRQLDHLARQAIRVTDLYEADYPIQHASPFLSSFYSDALARGRDIYTDYGARYNNSSINAIGLGTAADSLYTIEKLVYTDGTLTLGELADLLQNDWADHEVLRLTVKNRFPKFGQGLPAPDGYAGRLVARLDAAINRTPNVKGGVYRLSTFSIDNRWEWGRYTGASADGRRKGEPLSQNSGATFGCAKNGATAHLLSVASVGGDLTPNGGIADIDLHISQVRGENGLAAMLTTLRTYFSLGGFAVHYNVLDTATLRAAREDPTRYPDLQVRLCGWNVLFSQLSDKEKDEFIYRSEVGA